MSFDIIQNKFKTVIIGDVAVGKTTLLHVLKNKSFYGYYHTTIGVDCCVHDFDIDGINVSINYWDTAGQERYRSLTRSTLRGANCLFMVFDTNDYSTLESLNIWYKDISEMIDLSKTLLLIIGTKTDLESDVEKTDIDDFIKTHHGNFKYYSLSAKSNIDHVLQMFNDAARELLEIYNDSDDDVVEVIEIDSNNENLLFCCF